MTPPMIVHAGLIACRQNGSGVGGAWRGVLIEGPSGAGKSDLALRALQHGWRLVADDRTLLWACDGALFGRAPDVLAGLIEARGIGVIREEPRAFARIALIATLAESGGIERLPEPDSVQHLGVSLPRVRLAGLEPSALAKLAHALRHLGLGS